MPRCNRVFQRTSLVVSLLLGILSTPTHSAPAVRESPNPSAVPANQLVVSGNACGPASLLNAFRFGNSDWQRASAAIQGDNDRERILTIIREVGMRPSKHVPGRPRWSRRGISLADLRDMAAEMTTGKFLPYISDEVFFLKPGESPPKLLRRVHQRLEHSLAKGLPPILSIRRHALRSSGTGPPQWVIIDAHFVTLASLPRKLDKHSTSFPVTYIDPWGGRIRSGTIAIPAADVLPDSAGNPSCLQADFPDSPVGSKLVRKGEKSIVVLSAGIGRW